MNFMHLCNSYDVRNDVDFVHRGLGTGSIIIESVGPMLYESHFDLKPLTFKLITAGLNHIYAYNQFSKHSFNWFTFKFYFIFLLIHLYVEPKVYIFSLSAAVQNPLNVFFELWTLAYISLYILLLNRRMYWIERTMAIDKVSAQTNTEKQRWRKSERGKKI